MNAIFNNNFAAKHGSDIYLIYSEINCYDDYIIKLTDMTNNDFYQSLDDTVNSLIHFESQGSYNLNFVKNNIKITEIIYLIKIFLLFTLIYY